MERTRFKGRVCAMEGPAPNVILARQRLEPLGVEVYDVPNSKTLPFDGLLLTLSSAPRKATLMPSPNWSGASRTWL